MAEIKLSPWIILGYLTWTKRLVVFSIVALVLFNCVLTFLDIYAPELFARWLVFSHPTVDLVSNYVWAISHVSGHMRYWNDARVDTVVNFIAFDWLLYLGAMVITLPAVWFDVVRDGGKIRQVIEYQISTISTRWDDLVFKGRLSNIMLIYVLFSILCFLFVFTGIIYTGPIPLYHSDVDISLAIPFFYYALSLPLASLYLFLLRFHPENDLNRQGHR